METNNTAGIKTTYPYETTSPGVARHQCEECGAWERSDKGPIKHGKRCDSRPQVALAAAPKADTLSTFAANVRRTGLTKGRTEEQAAIRFKVDITTIKNRIALLDCDDKVLAAVEAVRMGHLSMSDAMNTDD